MIKLSDLATGGLVEKVHLKAECVEFTLMVTKTKEYPEAIAKINQTK